MKILKIDNLIVMRIKLNKRKIIYFDTLEIHMLYRRDDN